MEPIKKVLQFNDKVMGILENYERFILGNVSQVNAIENGLRTLTYILPGRFSDAELASEALYSLLNLIGLYHDKILTKVKKVTSMKIPKNHFNRYTEYLINASPMYKRCAYALSFIENLQVLLEMLYRKRYSDKNKFRFISWIETLKALLKLILLKLSKNRLLLSPPHPEREPQSNSNPLEYDFEVESSDPKDPMYMAKKSTSWVGKRTGYRHPHVSEVLNKPSNFGSSLDPAQRLLTSCTLDKDSARKPEMLVRRLSGIGLYSEYLTILRPMIYVYALRRFGLRSWKPWILSLTIETLAYYLSERALQDDGGPDVISNVELDELRRRRWLFGYYLLRSPMFDWMTKPLMLGFCDKTKDRFLLSFVSGMLRDYIPLWEQFYFYTSCS